MTSRSFLLLQGVASPFFSELEKALIHSGHEALKINFCGGDLFSGRFFSTALKHINFRDTLEQLPEFYATIFNQHQITDIILFGDTRPVHLPAIKLAKEQNISIHVYEEGYFRPNWVTLDNGGVNAHSSLSKNPDWFLDLIKNTQPNTANSLPTGGGLAIRAWHDIRYHLAKTLLKPLFPHYKTHRPDNAFDEYLGFIRRMPALKFYYNQQSNRKISTLLKQQKPFYLLPLQLGADAQIRIHSPLNSVTEMIHLCIQSFAKHAPKDALLVIKNHPLDPWFENYPQTINDAANQAKIEAERIVFLESGDLISLLKKAQGTVLVNSTVGTSALSLDCPVIALGDAIYDMPGLTFQGKLDNFWTQASPPDKKLFNAFKAAVIEKTQLNGSFYNQKGIAMAVASSMPFLEVKQTPQSAPENPDIDTRHLLRNSH